MTMIETPGIQILRWHVQMNGMSEVYRFRKKQKEIPMEEKLLVVLFLRWSGEERSIC